VNGYHNVNETLRHVKGRGLIVLRWFAHFRQQVGRIMNLFS